MAVAARYREYNTGLGNKKRNENIKKQDITKQK
jgi:hypothetical protein